MSFACEECQQAAASMRCTECSQSLCSICDATLHAGGTRKSHKRSPFAQPTFRSITPDTVSVKIAAPNKPANIDTAVSQLPRSREGDRTSAYIFEDPEVANKSLMSAFNNMQTDLQKEMTNVGSNKDVERSCPTCQKQLKKDETFIHALGLRFHPSCFVCSHCAKVFGDSSYVEHDGKAYCPADHKMLFSNKCYVCGGYVKDKLVRALGRSYHAEHFTCTHCNTPLSNNFVEHQGKPYCHNDYAKLFGAICPICSKSVVGSYVDTNGSRLHQDCFRCSTCRVSLLSQKAFSHNGQAFCEAHFHEQNNSNCGVCRKPVVGKAVSAFGQTFHTDCFNCAVCSTRLTGNFYEIQGKPYCEIHKTGKK